jgi:4-amino-4-deoxychorismate lyase
MKYLRKSTCRLVETLRMENGQLLNTSYHNQRMNRAQRELWGITEPKDVAEEYERLKEQTKATHLSFADHRASLVPEERREQKVTDGGREQNNDTKRYKVHLEYDSSGFHFLSVLPYRCRPINTLRLVEGGDIDYSYKYADRSSLNALLAERGTCDEILIVKDGLLTDTSFTNIALFDGCHWLTPRRPLLAGTHRQRLLARGIISEADIRAADIQQFFRIRLFNAMVDWGEWDLPVTASTIVER